MRYERFIGAIVVLLVIGLLFFAGPASAALSLDFSADKKYAYDDITFTGDIEIDSNQNVEIDYIVLTIKQGSHIEKLCKFYPNGTAISGCSDISISLIQSTQYGYGYGYGNGYGYGYNQGRFMYRIKVDVDKFNIDSYDTFFKVYLKDSSSEEIEGPAFRVRERSDGDNEPRQVIEPIPLNYDYNPGVHSYGGNIVLSNVNRESRSGFSSNLGFDLGFLLEGGFIWVWILLLANFILLELILVVKVAKR